MRRNGNTDTKEVASTIRPAVRLVLDRFTLFHGLKMFQRQFTGRLVILRNCLGRKIGAGFVGQLTRSLQNEMVLL